MRLFSLRFGGTGSIVSINGDSTPAQVIVGGTGINVSSTGGTTTVTNTSPDSGANTALSNLTNPTSINQDLLPDSDINRNIGAPALAWLNLYISSILDSANNEIMNASSRQLFNAAGILTIDFAAQTLYDQVGGGNVCLDWATRILYDNSFRASLDWDNRILVDALANSSIEWENRLLIDSSTAQSMNWDLRTAYDSSSFDSINWESREAFSNTGVSIDWQNFFLNDGSGIQSIYWESRALFDNAATVSVDWQNRSLSDGAGVTSVSYQNRILYDAAGVSAFDWGTALGIAKATQSYGSAYQRVTPATGATVTIADKISNLVIRPAGTIATLTVNMPATPIDSQEVVICSSQIITALTIAGNGHTVIGGITTLGVGGFAKYKYVQTDSSFYRIG